ncbi:MAG: S49 family peptidase [Phycisphaeraceae bacterium]|nr:S49 family peptidase [Phycisphaeraceae bacterium]
MTTTLRALALLMSMGAMVLAGSVRAAEPKVETAKLPPLVGWLELHGELHEGQLPYAWLSEQDAGPTLATVLKQLQGVRSGERYRGLVIYLDEPLLSLTQIDALGRSIAQVRQAGKKVLVFAEGYTLRDYLLASYADQVMLQHKGSVLLEGMSMEEMYLTGLLEKIGVRADLEQIGKYKGAQEQLTRRTPSEFWSQNIDSLMDDLYGQVLDAIAANRGVERPRVEQWMRQCLTMTDEQLKQAGIVDALVDRDLVEATELAYGDDFIWDQEMGVVEPTRPADSPFAIFSMLMTKPQPAPRRASLAIIHANGPIVSGESGVGDGFLMSDMIGSRTLGEILGDIADDDNFRGAIIQLDSPGGSALASEVIWQAIHQTAQDKPIYVSVGPMAASGGYYLACAADQIYVQPQSILGSIGVVGGKLALGGLYTKLDITVTQRQRGPMAGLFNSVDPFSLEQRAAVRAMMQVTYDQFLQRVREGRGTRLPDAEAVAEGRLFSGQAAVDNGLADKVGTLAEAVSDMAAKLNLKEGEYDVIHLPAPMSLEDFFNDLFQVQSPRVDASPGSLVPAELVLARRLLGPAAWTSVQRTLSGLMLLQQEPVLMLMPQTLVIK